LVIINEIIKKLKILSKLVLSNQRYFFITTLLTLFVVTSFYIVTTSHYVRYYADDFCSATILKRYGYWGTQKFWWLTWSGRYSSNLLIHFFELFGQGIVRIIPVLITILLTLSILPFLVSTLFRKMGVLAAVLFAYFWVVVVLINAPNIVQSLYWQSGLINYTIPFILLNLFFSLLALKQSNDLKLSKISLFTSSLILFFAGGFSESYAIAQTVLIIAMLLGVRVVNKSNNNLTKMLLAGLLGSTLSLLVMYFSPGTSARATTVAQASSIYFVIKSTILSSKWYLLRMFSIKSIQYSFLVSFVLIFYLVVKNYLNESRMKLKVRELNLIIILAFLNIIFSTASVFALGYYSMSYHPPERALFVVIYMVYISFLVISFCISAIFIKLFSKTAIEKISIIFNLSYFVIFIILLSQTVSHWRKIKTHIKNYAVAWDIQERKIIESSMNKDVNINYIKPPGDLDGFLENKGWVTSCASSYYGKKIIVSE